MSLLVKKEYGLPITNGRGLMDDMFGFAGIDSIFRDLWNAPARAHGAVRANAYRVDGGYQIDIEAPGLSKDAFNIQLEHDVISISANVEGKREVGGYHEFKQSSFKRTFLLPEGYDDERIEAKYDAGILKILVPVREDVKKTKKITVG